MNRKTQRVFAVKMNRNESESMDIIENHNDGIRQQTEQWNESRLIMKKGITLNDEESGSR